MKPATSLAFLVGALVLGGCLNTTPTDDPTRFYVLGTPATPTMPAADAETLDVGIRLEAFPPYLETSRMAYRRGEHEIVYLAFSRWAYPVEEGFQAALAAAIEVKQPAWSVFFWPYPRNLEPGRAYRLRIETFEPVGETARLEGRLVGPEGSRRFAHSVPLPAEGEQGARFADALGRAIAKLAAEIVDSAP